MFTLAQVETAERLIRGHFPGTPQYAWPLLAARAGCEVWVKHENHTPTGAFKVRGGLVYMDGLRSRGIISATRGNHGQSLAYAGAKHGIPVTSTKAKPWSMDANLAHCSYEAGMSLEHWQTRSLTNARRYPRGPQRLSPR